MSLSLPTTTRNLPVLDDEVGLGDHVDMVRKDITDGDDSMWYFPRSCNSPIVLPRKLLGGAISKII